MEKQRQKMLEGSVIKSILTLAIPVTLTNIFQSVYQLIDTFWVGRLGTNAVAAVSLSFPVIFFLTSLAMGFVSAGAILIAQYNGKGDLKNVQMSAGQTYSVVMISAFALGLLGYLISPYIILLFTEDQAVISDAISYLSISFIAIPAIFTYFFFQSALRAVGEVRIPLIIMLISVTLNFFLDPVLMFGYGPIPALGVTGVAYATLITESISAIIGISLMIYGFQGIKIRLCNLRLRFNWLKNIINLAIPASIEMSSRTLSMLLMTFLVSFFGTMAIAAYGIGTRILSFIIIPSIGFAIATAALVGNNLGAGQYERSEEIAKKGSQITFWFLTLLGIIAFIFAKQIAGFFVPESISLIEETALFLRLIALTFGFIGMQMVFVATIRASGKTVQAMLMATAVSIILLILAYVLAFLFDYSELGIWIAYPVSNVIGLLITYWYYRKKTWLTRLV